jgi:nicotinate-nucleotide adenylyltransferase
VIGILGGTFDPIHYGHLRPAAQVLLALDLAEIRFVPTARPPHREPPQASYEHRLRMVELAVASRDRLRVDDRESRIAGPSYTVHTLESLRAELGEQPLCLLIGSDAFRGIESWYQWQRLLQLASIIVMERPGSPISTITQLPPWARERVCHNRDEFICNSGGMLWLQHVDPQDISASRIRAMVEHGQSIAGLLPDVVWDYIRRNRLYHYKDQEV